MDSQISSDKKIERLAELLSDAKALADSLNLDYTTEFIETAQKMCADEATIARVCRYGGEQDVAVGFLLN